jgi:capsular polysaccharide export protein
MAIMTYSEIFKDSSNIVFLQGPMSPFFNKFPNLFPDKKIYKINLNFGDVIFSLGLDSYFFRQHIKNWVPFLEQYFFDNNIDTIALLGDCRIYHKKAIRLAKKLNIKVVVFEEGYIRPNYITCEINGVNANSDIVKHKKLLKPLLIQPKPEKTKSFFFTTQFMFSYAFLYYFFCNIFNFMSPNYIHHRNLNIFIEFKTLSFNIYNKIKNIFFERHLFKFIKNKRVFFVPLQVSSDYQVREHSSFNSMFDFLDFVVDSFSRNYKDNDVLVIKGHPMDRGRNNYNDHLLKLASKYNLTNLIYVEDSHLPSILKKTYAVITLNSTVGLQALFHGCRVISLSTSIYSNVTFNSTLDLFWNSHYASIYNKNIRYFLINNTQVNDSFF